jgi:class 3 adenylate cyclase
MQAGLWWAVREAVDAVRYRPPETALALAGAAANGVAPGVMGWLARTSIRVVGARGRREQRRDDERSATRALAQWSGGAVGRATDRLSAQLVDRLVGGQAHPGMLVPHRHEVGVVAVDMRGFSRLTSELHDTQYLARLVSQYQTVLTTAIERHHGLVFQYTGDGLLAVFLRELTNLAPDAMLDRLATRALPDLHADFTRLSRDWRAEWRRAGIRVNRIALGSGLSFGWVTLGIMGPPGKEHVGVLGEPVNVAAFLCSQAPGGTLLIDRDSFARAGAPEPRAEVRRLRSKKPHQRMSSLLLRPRVHA